MQRVSIRFIDFFPDVRQRLAPPTGRYANRHQTDDVVRSVQPPSSSMADQSRQIKLAAAKKKVKTYISLTVVIRYFTE